MLEQINHLLPQKSEESPSETNQSHVPKQMSDVPQVSSHSLSPTHKKEEPQIPTPVLSSTAATEQTSSKPEGIPQHINQSSDTLQHVSKSDESLQTVNNTQSDSVSVEGVNKNFQDKENNAQNVSLGVISENQDSTKPTNKQSETVENPTNPADKITDDLEIKPEGEGHSKVIFTTGEDSDVDLDTIDLDNVTLDDNVETTPLPDILGGSFPSFDKKKD